MKQFVAFLKTNKKLKRVLMVFGWAFLAFALVNLVLLVMYKDRTYPGTKVQNQRIGSASRNDLQNKLSDLSLLPETFTFTYKDKSAEVKTKDLGIETSADQTAAIAVREKSWLPIANFIDPPEVSVTIKTNEDMFDAQVDKLAEIFKKEPTDARVAFENGVFSIASESDGYTLDKDALQRAINEGLSEQSTAIEVPVIVSSPKTKQTELGDDLQDLSDRQKVSVTYNFNGKTRKLTPAEIGSLHEPSGSTFVLAEAKVRDFIVAVGRSFGISVQNITDAVRDTKSSVQNKKPLNFTFKEAPKKTYTYCVSLRGVDASELSGFQNKLAAVYADSRGWSIDNQVSFVRVESGCNFRVWLSSADQMASFGAICDASWSCAVSPNVIVNFDRWRYGSTAWNQSGGSLEDYRAMVINHETGHWLGFGHKNCGGAGQPAPVMQQQSISLQGCVFNPWPVASERESLKKIIGI